MDTSRLMFGCPPELLKLISHSRLHSSRCASCVCLLPWERFQYTLLHAGTRLLSSGGYGNPPRLQLQRGCPCILVGPWAGAPMDADPHERSLEANTLLFECFFNSSASFALLHDLVGIVVVKKTCLLLMRTFFFQASLRTASLTSN